MDCVSAGLDYTSMGPDYTAAGLHYSPKGYLIPFKGYVAALSELCNSRTVQVNISQEFVTNRCIKTHPSEISEKLYHVP